MYEKDRENIKKTLPQTKCPTLLDEEEKLMRFNIMFYINRIYLRTYFSDKL